MSKTANKKQPSNDSEPLARKSSNPLVEYLTPESDLDQTLVPEIDFPVNGSEKVQE